MKKNRINQEEKKYINKYQRSFAKDMIDQTEIEYSVIKFDNQFYSSMKTKVYDYKRNKDVEVLISTVDLKEKLSLILNDKNQKYKKPLIDQAEKLYISINVFLPNSYFNKKQNIYILKNEIEKQL